MTGPALRAVFDPVERKTKFSRPKVRKLSSHERYFGRWREGERKGDDRGQLMEGEQLFDGRPPAASGQRQVTNQMPSAGGGGCL